MRPRNAILAAAGVLVIVACASVPEPAITEETIQRVIKSSFSSQAYAPDVLARLNQDEGQKMCSDARSDLAKVPPAQLGAFIEVARKDVKYPVRLMGDWKQGEAIAQSGFGLRFGSGAPDDPKRLNGGNCYACHQVAPQELSYGTIGPSLLGYGKQRGASEAMQRFVYEKVYNAWIYLPCSTMPRFGHHAFLTPEQITHVVALLLDPESPVNK